MNSKALNHWRWKVFGVVCLVVMQGVLAPVASQANAAGKAERPRQETASQQVLRKVMEDIRHCDKNLRYVYDRRTGKFTPMGLEKINGLKFKEIIDYEYVHFEIEETYEGMRVAHIWIRSKDSIRGDGSLVSVIMHGNFQSIREKLETVWNVKFKDAEPPSGPDEVVGEQYAESVTNIPAGRRTIAINSVPKEFSPYGRSLVLIHCIHTDN